MSSPIFDATTSDQQAEVFAADAPPSEPAPVVFPSDGTPFAAPQPDPAPVDGPLEVATAVAEAPAVPVVPVVPTDLPVPPGGHLHVLPSGYRVVLRGSRSIRNRDRAKMFAGVDFEASKMQAGFTVLSNILRLLIVAWDVRDFDDATGEPVGEILPVPTETDVDVLGGLSMDDGASLDEEAQKVQKLLMPNFDPSPDQTSPTQPSGV